MSAGTSIPTITPYFIAHGLGPNTTANTMVNSIDQKLRITEHVHPKLLSYRSKHTKHINQELFLPVQQII
jgi:hypothetical protein